LENIIDHVNIFINTDYLIMKLDIISVSNSTNTSTNVIILSSFINTGQSFKSRLNTHAQSRYSAVSSMCFQTRKRLVDLELEQDKNTVVI